MNEFQLGTITQSRLNLLCDFSQIINQYSNNAVCITLELDGTFENAKVFADFEITVQGLKKKYSMLVSNQKILLPGMITQYAGTLLVSLHGETDDGKILTTNHLLFEIEKTCDPEGAEPPPLDLWHTQVKEYMEIYLHEQIDPEMRTLFDQANKAVTDAATAAAAANAAKQLADTAASNANSEATAAQEAAEAANAAALAAQESKQAAKNAAAAANIAASNANSKASAADIAASNANSKASAANSAATNAQSIADDLVKKRDAGEFDGSPVQLQKSNTHLQWKLQNESAWKNLIALLDLIGATPQIKIGTVTTLASGSAATVTIGGTIDQPALNFGIPKGQDGKGSGDMLKADYDADGDGIVDLAKSVPWSGITGKPQTFAPAAHKHSISDITNFPTSLPANGGDSDTVSGHSVLSDVPADAKFTDTIYKHPSYTARSSGLYKITVDASGHVNAVDSVTKDDITALGIPGQDTNTVYVHPVTAGNKHIPAGGAAGQILRWSADGTAIWGSDNNTTYTTFKVATATSAGGIGLVPAPPAGKQASFLRGDGQWVVPTNTTYAVMTGATASAAGKAGLVPAPAASKQTSFLRGDGSWVVPTNTTYGVATQSTEGLMSAGDKKKLDSLSDEHLIRNVTLTAASFVANTDSYASFYGFCSDYTVEGMTETCKADYETEPGSDDIIERGNTMAGKIRFYASAQPSADVVLNNIVWKELG